MQKLQQTPSKSNFDWSRLGNRVPESADAGRPRPEDQGREFWSQSTSRFDSKYQFDSFNFERRDQGFSPERTYRPEPSSSGHNSKYNGNFESPATLQTSSSWSHSSSSSKTKSEMYTDVYINPFAQNWTPPNPVNPFHTSHHHHDQESLATLQTPSSWSHYNSSSKTKSEMYTDVNINPFAQNWTPPNSVNPFHTSRHHHDQESPATLQTPSSWSESSSSSKTKSEMYTDVNINPFAQNWTPPNPVNLIHMSHHHLNLSTIIFKSVYLTVLC